MGKQISITPETLLSITDDLDTAKCELLGFSFSFPSLSGGGLSIVQINELQNDFLELKTALIDLMERTSILMKNAATDASELDSTIADSMKIEESR